MHIDKDEQERRLRSVWKTRQSSGRLPMKIGATAKWDAYEKGSGWNADSYPTTYAPWILVEADCKYYTRIKVLRTVVEAVRNVWKKKRTSEIITTYSKAFTEKCVLCIMKWHTPWPILGAALLLSIGFDSMKVYFDNAMMQPPQATIYWCIYE